MRTQEVGYQVLNITSFSQQHRYNVHTVPTTHPLTFWWTEYQLLQFVRASQIDFKILPNDDDMHRTNTSPTVLSGGLIT